MDSDREPRETEWNRACEAGLRILAQLIARQLALDQDDVPQVDFPAVPANDATGQSAEHGELPLEGLPDPAR
ncbi:MAG: hypothetical protein WD208_13735 [Dehalococcoidia bacterium]